MSLHNGENSRLNENARFFFYKFLQFTDFCTDLRTLNNKYLNYQIEKPKYEEINLLSGNNITLRCLNSLRRITWQFLVNIFLDLFMFYYVKLKILKFDIYY